MTDIFEKTKDVMERKTFDRERTLKFSTPVILRFSAVMETITKKIKEDDLTCEEEDFVMKLAGFIMLGSLSEARGSEGVLETLKDIGAYQEGNQ